MAKPPRKMTLADDARDRYLDKHARPPTSVPVFVEEEGTGRHEGEDLQRIRRGRTTQKRFEHVEERLDKLEPAVARMDGKIDTMLEYAVKADAERERRSAADSLALERRRKYIIALIGAIGAAVALIVAALAGVL